LISLFVTFYILKSAIQLWIFQMIGPSVFGIQMGQKLDELDVIASMSNGMYLLMPPQPHQGFELYTAQVAPSAGVFWVAAAGEKHKEDPSGRFVRANITSLRSTLEAKYGRSELLNTVPHETSEKKWVMSIHNGEQFLSHWHSAYGSNLPEGLDTIVLSVIALDAFTSNVFLSYLFSNSEIGQRELDLATPL